VSDVVDRVVAALNEHDLDAFVECYAPDATIGDGREQIRATGHDEFRALYGSMFERYPNLHVEPGWKPPSDSSSSRRRPSPVEEGTSATSRSISSSAA